MHRAALRIGTTIILLEVLYVLFRVEHVEVIGYLARPLGVLWLPCLPCTSYEVPVFYCCSMAASSYRIRYGGRFGYKALVERVTHRAATALSVANEK